MNGNNNTCRVANGGDKIRILIHNVYSLTIQMSKYSVMNIGDSTSTCVQLFMCYHFILKNVMSAIAVHYLKVSGNKVFNRIATSKGSDEKRLNPDKISTSRTRASFSLRNVSVPWKKTNILDQYDVSIFKGYIHI